MQTNHAFCGFVATFVVEGDGTGSFEIVNLKLSGQLPEELTYMYHGILSLAAITATVAVKIKFPQQSGKVT